MGELKKTALNQTHHELGAKMVDFGGWDMPVQYTGILKEHEAVRTAAGLFDVSHMGVLEVYGKEASSYLDSMVPNNIGKLSDGKGLYTQLCHPEGGTIDDLLIFRLHSEHFHVIINASNRKKDQEWLEQHIQNFDCTLNSLSEQTSILALQGPKAEEILQPLIDLSINKTDFPNFAINTAKLKTTHTVFHLTRSGYTGEDGFELYVPSKDAETVWKTILESGESLGVKPIGLGARDTLRLEACLPLYGHELDDQTSPLEAALRWSVKFKKNSDFIGRQALLLQKEKGLKKKRVGFIMDGTRRAPRQGYRILSGDKVIGVVTSGSLSPTLNEPIGLGYIDSGYADLTQIEIEVRKQVLPAKIVKLPFYRRKS